MYKIWKCGNCNEVHWSCDFRHHEMNNCSCGKSGVDLEMYYCRYLGQVIQIKNLNWNIFDEILHNLKEQGYIPKTLDEAKEIWGDTVFINLASFVRELEDEIMDNYCKTIKVKDNVGS